MKNTLPIIKKKQQKLTLLIAEKEWALQLLKDKMSDLIDQEIDIRLLIKKRNQV